MNTCGQKIKPNIEHYSRVEHRVLSLLAVLDSVKYTITTNGLCEEGCGAYMIVIEFENTELTLDIGESIYFTLINGWKEDGEWEVHSHISGQILYDQGTQNIIRAASGAELQGAGLLIYW